MGCPSPTSPTRAPVAESFLSPGGTKGFELREALDIAVEIALATDDIPNRLCFEDARAILLDAIFPDLPEDE